MYTVRTDPVLQLVEVTLAGLIAEAEVADYVREIRGQIVGNRLRSYAIVVDVTACPIQRQDVVAAFGEHIATMPKARAIAIVVGGSLFRMQIRRLFTQPYARTVATAEEALAWVLRGTEPVAA